MMKNDVGVLWRSAAFDALTTTELYELLQLRTEVFVLEQNCLFQDIDGSDVQAMHLMGHIDGVLVAYARCFAAGVKFTEASIGRIATRTSVRGLGLGHQLVQQAVGVIRKSWGTQPIRIGAQARLKYFYQEHGFEDMGVPYVEDGIDHLEMVWQPNNHGDRHVE